MANTAENIPHRCLDIPEVVDFVFSLIRCDYRESLVHSSLAMLARTCKRFHDPAVKYLWRNLPGLHPIRNLFLPGAFILDKGSNEIPLWYMTYEFLADKEGFRRLRKYGPYVRSIAPAAGQLPTTIDFHYYALQQIYEHPECPKPLFPNIKVVELVDNPNLPLECIFYAPLVMSPAIKTITIVTSDGEQRLPNDLPLERVLSNARWDALAGRVTDAAPRLEKFTVYQRLIIDGFLGRVPALSSSIARFSKSLTTLSIEPLTVDKPTFTLIGQLPLLQTLVISLFEMHLEDLESVETMELPCLESLELTSTSMPACISFLTRYTMEQLAMLSLSIDLHADQDVAPLIAALASKSLSLHIEEINMFKANYRRPLGQSLTWDQMLHEPRFIVNPATLRTLASFTELTNLYIGACTRLEIEDGDLAKLFAACPLLSAFSLREQPMEPTPVVPKLTLKGVHDALNMTPLMHHLKIPVDCTTIPADDTPISPHKSLVFWDVQNSPIGSGTDFASWINQHYPALAYVDFFSTYQSGLASAYLSRRNNDDERDMVDGYEGTAVMYARWLDVKAHLAIKHDKLQNLREGFESVDADN